MSHFLSDWEMALFLFGEKGVEVICLEEEMDKLALTLMLD